MTALPPAPTLILGGFLITPEAYGPMATAIAAQTGQPVQVVPTTRLEWLRTGGRPGWRRLLDRSHDLLLALAAESPVGRVNLVGHSSGGVMLRLLLGDDPFAGRVYADRIRVQSLVTLGSPHQAVRGTALRREVAALYPGAPYAGELAYLAVAGAIEPAEHMQQGAFSTTGRAHNSGHLAFLNLNAESPQYFEVSVTLINGCTD